VGLFSVAFQIGSMFEVPQEDAEVFLEEFSELIEDIDGIGIFTHNLTIALPMFIPGFGIAWGLFASWSTGYAFAALATLSPELRSIPPLAALFATPFGLIELSAYSLAMSRSYIVIYKIIKKIAIKQDAKVIGIEVGIVVGLLLAGGIIEDIMIKFVVERGLDLPAFNGTGNSTG